jgi:phenylalanyl-tRNA synthetase beta subunit
LAGLLENYHISADINSSAHNSFVPGRHGNIMADSSSIAEFGQVMPRVLDSFGFGGELSFAEIKIDNILAAKVTPQPKPLPPYQYVSRSLALEISYDFTWQQLRRLIVGNKSVVAADFVDSYQDTKLKQAQRKSITIKLEFDLGPQPKSDQIEKSLQQVVQNLKADPKLKSLVVR